MAVDTLRKTSLDCKMTNQQEPNLQYVQAPVQVIPVPSQPLQNVPIPPKYVAVSEPQVVYIPVVNLEAQAEKPVGQSGVAPQQVPPNQGGAGVHPAQHHHQHPPSHTHPISFHQHDGTVHHVSHTPPPAPAPSASSYVATLSYGPGHPTVVYQCYLPGYQPQQTTIQPDHIVQGPNGHICAVSYHKFANYQVVHFVDQSRYPEGPNAGGPLSFVPQSDPHTPNEIRYGQ